LKALKEGVDPATGQPLDLGPEELASIAQLERLIQAIPEVEKKVER